MTEPYVKSETHKGITSIEFYHPQSNSLPGSILEDLAKRIHRYAIDPETILIILRSGGEKSFCAGASFDELVAITNEKEGLKFFSGFAHVINAMRECNKLIIGRIQGKCVGGGVGIAAACDYTIATEAAEVKLSELAIGIGPFVIGPAVERKIGTSAFSTLTIDAAIWRTAEWARRKGLFSEVHDTIENMDESLQRLADRLVHSSPQAMSEMKKIFWKGTEHWDKLLLERAALSGKLVLSEFTKNAIAKFKAKS
jgi:methylglutaconyl-CoA hydratase